MQILKLAFQPAFLFNELERITNLLFIVNHTSQLYALPIYHFYYLLATIIAKRLQIPTFSKHQRKYSLNTISCQTDQLCLLITAINVRSAHQNILFT